MDEPVRLDGLCPDCKQPWDGRYQCPHCGLTQDDLEAAAALLEEEEGRR